MLASKFLKSPSYAIPRWLAQLLMNVGFPDAANQLANDIVNPTPLTTS